MLSISYVSLVVICQSPTLTNFSSRALIAEGYRSTAFNQDNTAYVSHVIPPQEVSNVETPIEFTSIDVADTVSVTTTASPLYLFNETNADKPPANVLEGYRVGASMMTLEFTFLRQVLPLSVHLEL